MLNKQTYYEKKKKKKKCYIFSAYKTHGVLGVFRVETATALGMVDAFSI